MNEINMKVGDFQQVNNAMIMLTHYNLLIFYPFILLIGEKLSNNVQYVYPNI